MPDVVIVGAGIVGAACARAWPAGPRSRCSNAATQPSGTSAACEGNLLVSDKQPGPGTGSGQGGRCDLAAVAAELADELGPSFPSVEHEAKGGLVVVTSEPACPGCSGSPRPSGRPASTPSR